MKKIILLVAVVVAISFASCKKERSCVCTQTLSGQTVVTTTKVKSGKKDAESWCSASNGSKTTVTVNGIPVANTGGTTQTCEVK